MAFAGAISGGDSIYKFQRRRVSVFPRLERGGALLVVYCCCCCCCSVGLCGGFSGIEYVYPVLRGEVSSNRINSITLHRTIIVVVQQGT